MPSKLWLYSPEISNRSIEHHKQEQQANNIVIAFQQVVINKIYKFRCDDDHVQSDQSDQLENWLANLIKSQLN